MFTELRCDRHLHGRVIPNATIFEIKCGRCSRQQGREVKHYFLIAEGEVRPVSLDVDPHEAPQQRAS